MLRRVSPKMEVPWTLVRGAPHTIQRLMQPVKIRQFRQPVYFTSGKPPVKYTLGSQCVVVQVSARHIYNMPCSRFPP